MSVFVWLTGDGYFKESLYGKFELEELPAEILMHHYENPAAKMQGVTILGITKKGPDDITVVERYTKSHKIGHHVYYEFQGTVDPSQVVKRDTPDGDYVLEMREDVGPEA